MFGILKNIFGFEEAKYDMKGDVVSALESAVSASNCNGVLNQAESLRNQLRSNSRPLTNDEKVRIVKALNKAKVRALMGGTTESYTAFRNLDSISSDVVQLL
jgi:hypothetical protein